MSSKLYQEELMEHFKHPLNKGRLKDPDMTSGEYNPSCGDKVCVDCKMKDGVITEIGFVGSGCVISQASASMITDFCRGKSVDDILAITKDDILSLLGIELGPNRLRCALLTLQALQSGLQKKKEE
jgi:nitrogen fixation protein NifU and related proteins